MGNLQCRTKLLEFTISDNTSDMLAAILETAPNIIGFGVYIWNVEPTTHLIADLKRVRPETIVVLGGPEVSFDSPPDTVQPICQLADFVIQGEADVAFGDLCRDIIKKQLREKWINHHDLM